MFTFKYKDYHFECDAGTMTPSQYILMILLLEQHKPVRICELGSGQSTRIFEAYANANLAQYMSIEDNLLYLTRNGIYMPIANSDEYIVGDNRYIRCMFYLGLELWLNTLDKFDFVLIDGPNDVLPFNRFSLDYSRVLLLSFILLDKLSDNCTVLYHDCNNEQALNTLLEFERLLVDKQYEYQIQIIEEPDQQIVLYNKDILGMCPKLAIYKINKNDSRTKDKEEKSLGGADQI